MSVRIMMYSLESLLITMCPYRPHGDASDVCFVKNISFATLACIMQPGLIAALKCSPLKQ